MSSTPRFSRTRRAGAVLAASAIAVTGTYALLGPGLGAASSHREAPLIANDPQADTTDVYAFVSPDAPDTVTMIVNVYPVQDPAGGPNFYPFASEDTARYNLKIDNNGDALPDVTYRWEFQTIDNRGEVVYPDDGPEDTVADGSFLYNNGPVTSFDDATLLFKQTYTLTQIDGGGAETVLAEGVPVAPSRVGDASMPDYQALRDEAVVSLDNGGQAFAGQADDPFFLDLRVFDLLYGADLSEVGDNTLVGKNVNSMAIQVPISDVVTGDDPVIGIHATTERPSTRVQNAADGSQTYEGDFVQISRLGNPLVNEVVLSANLKDTFNAVPPVADATIDEVVNKVLFPEVPYLLEVIYGLESKDTPRNDLFTIFLTGLNDLNMPVEPVPSEQLRLNTDIPVTEEPNRLGVLAGDNQGFPNGRRLTDDVVDIELQVLAGAVTVDDEGTATDVTIVDALAAGDVVNENDKPFGDTFPYLALPTSGSTPSECGCPEPTPSPTPTPTPTETPTDPEPTETPTDPLPTGPPPTGTADDGSGIPLLPLGAATIALGLLGYGALSLRKQQGATNS